MAGGSGITPVFQTIMEIAAMTDEQMEIVLLFANKTEEDIVLRKELESMGAKIKLHYILDSAPREGLEALQGVRDARDPEGDLSAGRPGHGLHPLRAGPMNQFIRTLFAELYPQSVLFKFLSAYSPSHRSLTFLPRLTSLPTTRANTQSLLSVKWIYLGRIRGPPESRGPCRRRCRS